MDAGDAALSADGSGAGPGDRVDENRGSDETKDADQNPGDAGGDTSDGNSGNAASASIDGSAGGRDAVNSDGQADVVSGDVAALAEVGTGGCPDPQHVAITEFPMASASGAPRGITAGPDGNLWFAENPDKIGRITTSGAITEFTLPSSLAYPQVIVAGSDGAVWFTAVTSEIGRITTAGEISEFALPSSLANPMDITAGPDGNIWFTTPEAIGRITPDGVIAGFNAPSYSYPEYCGITTGPDGNLWFANEYGNSIVRSTPDGKFTEFSLPIPPGDAAPPNIPIDITVGPDGNLWFTVPNLGYVGRMTPNGGLTEFNGGNLVEDVGSIVAGADGNIWVAGNYASITCMTMSGVHTDYLLPNSSSPSVRSVRIAAGPDGAIWFSDYQARQIGRIGVSP